MKKLKELLSFQLPQKIRNLQVNGVCDNSKNVEDGNMFVAVVGSNLNGANYIEDAIHRGAKFVVTAGNFSVEDKNGVIFICVPDIRKELAHIASKFFKSHFDNVVAVTGTNGKSSTVDILRQIWTSSKINAASIGTLGIITKEKCEKLSGNLTSPGSIELHKILHQLSRNAVSCVAMEASSHGIVQHRLDEVPFNVCAFTNLTQDHLDYHKTIENYWLAKSKLFSDLSNKNTVFVANADSEYFSQILKIANDKQLQCVGYGYQADDVKILSVESDGIYQKVKGSFFGQDVSFRLPLQGGFQVYNSMCAAAICYLTGVKIESIINALENLSPINGRLELVATHNSANIYVDYAHTPDALENAILSLRTHTRNRLVVLFGCGGDRDKQKREIMGKVACECADVVIVTDDNPRNESPSIIRSMILQGCCDAIEIAGRDRAIRFAIDQLTNGDTLLIAGKGHEDYQLIKGDKIHFSDKEVILEAVKNDFF